MKDSNKMRKKRIKALDGINELGPINSWKLLSMSIIKQAVVDWRDASICMQKPETSTKEMSWQKRETEMFFRSDWFDVLSDMDGQSMLRRMKEWL